jgi:restriction system protein
MRTGKPTDHILAPVIAAEPTKAVINSAQAPRCPKCGGEMILRTAKSGANVGNRFWGCSAYPACKGIVAATSN